MVDGVALVDSRSVTVVPAGHLWADRVLRAIGFDPFRLPLIDFEGGYAVHVDRSDLTISPAFGRQQMSLEDVVNTGGDVYLHGRFRSMLLFENGAFVPHAMPRDTRVIVRKAVAADRPSALGTVLPPDLRIHGGAEWLRIGGIGAGSNTGSTGAPGGVVPASSGQILLVCPDTDESLPGCDQ
jgi:hypothetical protein